MASRKRHQNYAQRMPGRKTKKRVHTFCLNASIRVDYLRGTRHGRTQFLRSSLYAVNSTHRARHCALVRIACSPSSQRLTRVASRSSLKRTVDCARSSTGLVLTKMLGGAFAIPLAIHLRAHSHGAVSFGHAALLLGILSAWSSLAREQWRCRVKVAQAKRTRQRTLVTHACVSLA